MEKTIKLAFALLLCLSAFFSNAQDRPKKEAAAFGKPIKLQSHNGAQCATAEYEAYLQAKNPNLSKENFENWLAPKVAAVKNRIIKKDNPEIITLPVVVHIIHTGVTPGLGGYLTDEQVLSQIAVLNQDYRRAEDTPGYNENPVGADIGIEFCLAQRDPEGNATNGITRTQIQIEEWEVMDIEMNMKPITQWDPERYINIWVCRIGGEDEGLGGYAFFPSDSNLEGLEGFEGLPESSNGVVIDYRVFGSADIYPEGDFMTNYNKGRTTTHELGHYLGLRHIWGDEENCTGTDYCDDTPTTAEANTGCSPIDSCFEDEEPDMIENYMDYTYDACKNTFTLDQKARMLAVLESSPKRSILLSSDACVPVGLGLNENNSLPGIIIYPNPVNDVLHIVSAVDGKGNYTVYNAIGQVVAVGAASFDKETAIEISQLSAGVYIIKIDVEGKSKTARFIKE
jgi:hypothetical protein